MTPKAQKVIDIFRAPNGDEFYLTECGSRHLVIIECVFRDQENYNPKATGMLLNRFALVGYYQGIPNNYVNEHQAIYRVWSEK